MRKEAGKTDGLLLLTVFVLAGFGLLVLYSMSAYNGQVRFGDAAYYLKKQLFAMLFGFCLMYGIARLDYHTLERFAVPAYLISLALSGAVLLFALHDLTVARAVVFLPACGVRKARSHLAARLCGEPYPG